MILLYRTLQAVLLAFFVVFLSCASVEDRQQQEEMQLYQDVRDEITIGRAMAAKLAGHFGYYDADIGLTQYLNLVGASVAAQGNRPEINFYFGVLKLDEINAFATPGGYIFVTLPLLRAVQSESELAGILGHEIAHVTEKHMYKEIAPKRQMSTGEVLTRFLSRGGSDLGFSLGKIVNSGIEILLEKGLGEEKESSADQAGTILASSVGYDGYGLFNFLTRLEKESKTVKISKTHPPFPKRLEVLSLFLKKNGISDAHQNEPKNRIKRFEEALIHIKK